ncbi:hypothetical protein BABINDRAFT_33228 [Babjeviella inositovora NRRL Y-12698]|uniref:Methyltransferase domain-containing protein n=1 Tax=Babjeviella inositovora NRRL Y-12698 TaxID=984486 RepID=A0A1E3QX92_9ASCO|nr:uncharacterized protein BABINDRAFT_33228 [Babjeviella inositovora NRRL Y-12698]ODQ82134.1 hypothetical protein BABINDRAFT_33228 [Babjeviella inositovora NRRL Y-12698]
MPRLIPQSVYRLAAKHSPLLPYFIPACHNLAAAKQELHWVKQELPETQWLDAARLRKQHYPLQYILGTQPFGELDIRCKPGVLIPRWETEEWVLQLARVLSPIVESKQNYGILDLCTGTGCIPLLLQHELGSTIKQSKPQNVRTIGVDISPLAVELARKNSQTTVLPTQFVQGDVFEPQTVMASMHEMDFRPDFITANPPYIPRKQFEASRFEKSVKQHEPELALVGDSEFYRTLVEKWINPMRVQGFVFELGEVHQCEYTRDLLGNDWDCGILYDSNSQVRCVVGWVKGGEYETLRGLCQKVY